jgi:tRNA threonylcarbamoyladenosine biosynthesis protein TsaB
MRILAIDTATEACSAALLDGERCVARYEEPGRGHAERILPMVGEVLREAGMTLAQVDGIAVGRGPGAFTGVRIAISVAQGLAFAVDRKIALVSDLAALAQRAVDDHDAPTVLAGIDARMGEVYWGVYERGPDGLVALVGEEQVTAAGEVRFPPGADWHGAGSAWAVEGLVRRAQSMGGSETRLHAASFPRAHEIARLSVPLFRGGHAVPPDHALPVYLRDRVAVPVSHRPRN